MTPKWSRKFQLKPGKWVFVPTNETFSKGREIKRTIEGRWKHPPYFYHLRRGGHVLALKSHLRHSTFVRFDIQDFFGSINRTRITRCLKTKFGYAKAREWANASTVLDPENPKRSILPFGFVQSPVLASLCLHESALGQYLVRLRKSRRFMITVYVDDVIISCGEAHSQELTEQILPAMKKAAERARFTFSAEKSQGPGASITAFNIQLSHASMRVENGRMGEFVAALEKSASAFERAGIVGYVSSVNTEQGSDLVGDAAR